MPSVVIPPYDSSLDASYQPLDRTEAKPSNTKQIVFFVGLCAFLVFLMFSPRLFPGSPRGFLDRTPYSYVTCTFNASDLSPDTRLHPCRDPKNYKLHYNLTQTQIASKLSKDEVILARAFFDDLIDSTGWSTLIVDSVATVGDDNSQAVAAGYLEGFITSERITQALINGNDGFWEKKPEGAYEKVQQWLKQQETYINSQIDLYVYSTASTPAMKTYWAAVEIVSKSLHGGMVAGYVAALAERKEENKFDLSVQLFRSEFGDIINNIFPEITKNCWDMATQELDEFIGKGEHCSSLSKTTVDVSSLSCAPYTKTTAPTGLITKQVHGFIDDILIIDETTPEQAKIMKSVKKTKTFLVTDDDDLSSNGKTVQCTMEYTNDFIVAHDTWTSFYDLLRIIKTYKFDLSLYKQIHYQDDTTTKLEDQEPFTITLTGYPGLITSYDDYYILPAEKQRLIITETTNTNCNKELYTYISPRSILTSERAFIASILANTSHSWATYYAKENSGTYNNQWMIVDTKLWSGNTDTAQTSPNGEEMIEISIEFLSPEMRESVLKITKKTDYPHPDEILNVQVAATHYPTGFYVIAEQTPQIVEIKDVSSFVNNKTYWPSYNRPYLVYHSMGFDTATEKLGDFYSYTNYSRAREMNRDLPPFFLSSGGETNGNRQNTATFNDIMRYMRYNNFEKEEFAQQCPIYTIAARYDLIPVEGCGSPLSRASARGQTDVKISSVNAINAIYFTKSYANEYFPMGTVFAGIENTGNRLNFRGNSAFHHKTDVNAELQKPLLWVIAGPTTGNDAIGEALPNFTWDDPRWKAIPHLGHPAVFNFTWVEIQHPN